MLRSIKFRELPDFLLNMYKEIQEEELWRIYLSNPFREGSFEDWKIAAMGDGRTKEDIETEATTAAANALKMLNGIGGDDVGH